MHFEKEYSNQYNFYIPFIADNMNYEEHFHADFELLYIIHGTLRATIDENSYDMTKGQFALIFPNQAHSYKSIGETKSFNCIFSTDMVNTFSRMTNGSLPDSPLFTLHDMSVLHELILYHAPDTLLLQSYLFYICSEFMKQRSLTKSLPHKRILKNQIANYVSSHFSQNLTLHDVSQNLGYNYHYLSRFFSENFSMNFRAFLNQYRMDYAKHMLIETNDSITSIALSCGFESIRSFNRVFRNATNQTPSEYRNN